MAHRVIKLTRAAIVAGIMLAVGVYGRRIAREQWYWQQLLTGPQHQRIACARRITRNRLIQHTALLRVVAGWIEDSAVLRQEQERSKP